MITYKDELLQQIASGLDKLDHCHLGCVKVTFKTNTDAFEFTLARALDVLSNNFYWDERGNWSEARIADVNVF